MIWRFWKLTFSSMVSDHIMHYFNQNILLVSYNIVDLFN